MCRLGLVVGAALVALSAAPAGSSACGWPGYSYAGVLADRPVTAVAATVATVRAPQVESGHVAAWVGVGGSGAGPGGEDAWLQVGLVAREDRRPALYVEWKRPGAGRRYVELGPAGDEPRRLLVRELPGRPSAWQAFVDGRPAGPVVTLPESHGRLPGAATAESWDGGRPACNRFAFRYERVRLRAGATPVALVELEDPGYRVERRERATFVARSRR